MVNNPQLDIQISSKTRVRLLTQGTAMNPRETQGTPRILKINPIQSFINGKLVYMHFSLHMNIFFSII